MNLDHRLENSNENPVYYAAEANENESSDPGVRNIPVTSDNIDDENSANEDCIDCESNDTETTIENDETDISIDAASYDSMGSNISYFDSSNSSGKEETSEDDIGDLNFEHDEEYGELFNVLCAEYYGALTRRAERNQSDSSDSDEIYGFEVEFNNIPFSYHTSVDENSEEDWTDIDENSAEEENDSNEENIEEEENDSNEEYSDILSGNDISSESDENSDSTESDINSSEPDEARNRDANFSSNSIIHYQNNIIEEPDSISEVDPIESLPPDPDESFSNDPIIEPPMHMPSRIIMPSNSVCSTSNGLSENTPTVEYCSICCEVMVNDQTIKTFRCGHKFHSECIMLWLVVEITCPNCRRVVI